MASIRQAALGVIGSGLVHLAGLGIYLATSDLSPPPQQQGAQTRLKLETFSAPVEDAVAASPQSDAVQAEDPEGAILDQGAIAQSHAKPLTVPTESARQSQLSAENLQSLTNSGSKIAPSTTLSQSALRPQNVPADQTQAQAVVGETITPDISQRGQKVATLTPRDQPAEITPIIADQALAQSVLMPAENLVSQSPIAEPIAAATATAQSVLATDADADVIITGLDIASQAAQNLAPNVQDAPLSSSQGIAIQQEEAQAALAAEASLPAESARATSVWQFADRIVTDPTSVATIQAFLEPNALERANSNADKVKDDLSATLQNMECARVSATFLPEVGALELRGHIPDMSMRDAILATMQTEVGQGIPVTANLLHLPSPQCNMLGGIADVGLAQSTDQFTNPLLIGATAHAREYNYSEGQRLQFDLTAPDYDAFVYVDFFTADGEVIHLSPNEYVSLEKQAAKSAFGVGKDKLELTIGPPYGREIAVAFAASSPIYSGLRPIVEPAAEYLEFMKESVAKARDQSPDFKGEWVYFFITTAPATQ